MEWYVNTLGFERVFSDQWSGVPLFLRLGSTFIALFPHKEENQLGNGETLSHLAFRAATNRDFELAQTELNSKGIAFGFEDHGISRSIYFVDPDGFQLEITTYDGLGAGSD
jgi:catechol-2,3-dioxygenase